MNIQNQLDMHDKAIFKLEDIQSKRKSIVILEQSINGMGGSNFPELIFVWINQVTALESRIKELKVEYKMILNSLK